MNLVKCSKPEKISQISKAISAGLTYQQIGTNLGISRQRVQQLVAPSPEIRQIIIDREHGACQVCGMQVNDCGHIHHLSPYEQNYNGLSNLQLLCSSCHAKIHHPHKIRLCLACGNRLPENFYGKYCSPECLDNMRILTHYIKLVCENCGKTFLRVRRQALDRYVRPESWEKRTHLYFCSRQCQGAWLGKNHGWGKQKKGGNNA